MLCSCILPFRVLSNLDAAACIKTPISVAPVLFFMYSFFLHVSNPILFFYFCASEHFIKSFNDFLPVCSSYYLSPFMFFFLVVLYKSSLSFAHIT